MFKIDGSHGEGGGSIVRTAVALSAITQKPIRITNIRSGRRNPGLRAQHAEVIKAVAQLCGAKTKSVSVGSKEIEFRPGPIKKHNITVRIPTAGSVGLLLQSLLIAAGHAKNPVTVTVSGGAVSGKWAAPVHYMKHVLLPLLSKMNYECDIDIEKYGYYPKGGSRVSAKMSPADLKPIGLTEKGELKEIRGVSHASTHLKEAKVADRQKRSAEELLSGLDVPVNIEVKYVKADNPGSAIELYALHENSVVGGDGLGERGKPAERVGEEAAENLSDAIGSGASVDHHAEDMLIPYMALAAEKGPSKLRVPEFTSHTKTNTWLCEEMLSVKFEYQKENKIISVRRSEGR